MKHPTGEVDERFIAEDIPKILQALQDAHRAKVTTRVIVDFSDSGSVMTVQVESKKRYK